MLYFLSAAFLAIIVGFDAVDKNDMDRPCIHLFRGLHFMGCRPDHDISYFRHSQLVYVDGVSLQTGPDGIDRRALNERDRSLI